MTIWVVELLYYEIGNGGLDQYFASTRGEYASETRTP
jgi:hypothetical protein